MLWTAAAALSDQALRNLGVTIGEATASTFVRHSKVQAMVVDAPLNAVPVAAPLGGIVTKLHARPGQVVKAGAPLVSVARSPIPRPRLELTADILTPVSENLHQAVAQLRTATAQYAIASAQFERVSKFTSDMEDELPLLPRRTLDLKYDLARAKQAKANAEQELARHGLSRFEIKEVLAGKLPPGNQSLWQRALQQNGLWGRVENAVLESLPERQQGLPWSIAAIGELSAAGLATDELAQAMHANPAMAKHFVEVASLLLEGNTAAKVKILAEAGALDPIMVLRAPAGAPDWDLSEVHVLPGQRVDAGSSVVLLHDARRMWLSLEPVGGELALVASACEEGAALTARPLITGTGPDLDGLRIHRLDTRAGETRRGAVAFIVAANEAFAGAQPDTRSWKLRIGLRYLVLLPREVLENRIVLPAGAVTDLGQERVVFVRDGTSFRAQPVHVEYEDDEVVVLANDGSLFPGDPVVRTGAFALGLALQSGDTFDPHAGHDHG